MRDRSGPDYSHVGRRLTSLLHCALYRRTLRLTCPNCKRIRRIDGVGLWWHFHSNHWDDRIPQAFRRLFCATCVQSSGIKYIPRGEVTTDVPEPDDFQRPSEREWKKIVSRYRS